MDPVSGAPSASNNLELQGRLSVLEKAVKDLTEEKRALVSYAAELEEHLEQYQSTPRENHENESFALARSQVLELKEGSESSLSTFFERLESAPVSPTFTVPRQTFRTPAAEKSNGSQPKSSILRATQEYFIHPKPAPEDRHHPPLPTPRSLTRVVRDLPALDIQAPESPKTPVASISQLRTRTGTPSSPASASFLRETDDFDGTVQGTLRRAIQHAKQFQTNSLSLTKAHQQRDKSAARHIPEKATKLRLNLSKERHSVATVLDLKKAVKYLQGLDHLPRLWVGSDELLQDGILLEDAGIPLEVLVHVL